MEVILGTVWTQGGNGSQGPEGDQDTGDRWARHYRRELIALGGQDLRE